MKIDTFVLGWNEEKRIRDFISWYHGTNITLLDNYSSDNTANIAYENGCKVIQYGDNTQNNVHMLEIKESCWKNSDADWVIVCDMDEFLYHPKFFKILSTTKTTIIKCVGYNMISEIPLPISEINIGARDFRGDKSICFRPDRIDSMNWLYGCHLCNPKGEIKYLINTVKLFHYHHAGRKEFKERRLTYKNRMSNWDKDNKAGIHYEMSEQAMDEEFDNILHNAYTCK